MGSIEPTILASWKLFCEEAVERVEPKPMQAEWDGFGGAGVQILPNPSVAITTRNKKLLGAPGIATRSKDATRNKDYSPGCHHSACDVYS